MPAGARYDIVQTVFLMSMVSNAASSVFQTEKDLTNTITVALNGGIAPNGQSYAGFFALNNPRLAGGDWQLVWGPCVYSRFPHLPVPAANAMFVAHSPSLSTYVVAVAATNPVSVYDWIQEDGDVIPGNMALWPFTAPFAAPPLPLFPPYPNGKSAISGATALGVTNLLTKLSDPYVPWPFDPNHIGSIQNFLNGIANRAASTLIFAGHSLAGALAPTLALYLYPDPNPAVSGWMNIHVLPTAGASAGNQAFARAFEAAYPPVSSGIVAPYGNWNTDYANNKDLVPHAWNQLAGWISPQSADKTYPSVWGTMDEEIGMALSIAIDGATALSCGNYINLTQTKFSVPWGRWDWIENSDGSWQYPPAWQPLPDYTPENPVSSLEGVGLVLSSAHTDQYYPFFNISQPPVRMPKKP